MAFFKQGKPREFNYQPRVYDERKEQLEERIDRIKMEMGLKEYEPGKSIRGSFQAARKRKGDGSLLGGLFPQKMARFIKIGSVILIAVIIYILVRVVNRTYEGYVGKQVQREQRVRENFAE